MSRFTSRLAALPVLLGAPLLLSGFLHAQDSRGESGPFHWSSPTELLYLTRPISERAPEELAAIQDWLALPPAPAGELLWLRDKEALQQALDFPAPDWFAAVTQPGKRRILMVVDAAHGQQQLLQTFRHELVHWQMQTLGARAWAQLPAWFHEGVAQTWAVDVGRPSVSVSLAWAAFHGELPWLGEYRDGFGKDAYHAAMGYALGEAFVRRLIRVEGKSILPALMQHLRQGENLDQALLALTELPLIDHEMALRLELGSWRALMAEMAPQSFLFLTLVLLVALPLAMRRRRLRHQAALARWEAEEASVEAASALSQQEEDDRWLHLN